MLDEMTKARLHTIMAHAIEYCEEAIQDHDWNKADHLMHVACGAEHICRKNWMIEHHMQERHDMMN